jgi:hypothetical protein
MPMKKSKIISLVLISASFTGCMEYTTIVVNSGSNGPVGDTVRTYANQPYYNNYNYFNGYYGNWNPLRNLWWNGRRNTACYNRYGHAYHYGPRQGINGNIARRFAGPNVSRVVARGGLGSTSHGSGGARSVAA